MDSDELLESGARKMMAQIFSSDWRKWSLEQKIAYLKGSGGGFNLKRQDIAALPDHSRGVHYEMKAIRMAMDVIEELVDMLRYARLDVESKPRKL